MPNDTIPAQIDREALTLAAYDSEHVRARLIARALVEAERRGLERAADEARRVGSEYNWLWNDNVEPEANKNRRDGAYAAEAAIRKLMESSDEA